VRTAVSGISVLGRNTQGVKLIAMAEGERLSSIERIVGLDEGNGTSSEPASPDDAGPAAASDPDAEPGAGSDAEPDGEQDPGPDSDPSFD
jgi:DNA gyrase subunit A